MRAVNGISLIMATTVMSIAAPAAFSKCQSPPIEGATLLSNPAAAVLGATPTEIDARFAGVIEQNFRTGSPNNIVHALTSRELADLAAIYKQAGGTTTLLELIAKDVDADGLASVASAFGQDETAAAVKSYAPHAVYLKFNALPVRIAAEPSLQVTAAFAGRNLSGGRISPAASPAPTVDMTPYEIYLEYRTAPVGSLSVEGALYETSVFIGKNVTIAYTIGTGLGAIANSVIQNYDPSLYDAIGGTVAGMVDQMQSAIAAATQGQLEKAMDNLFGIPIAYSNPGDFDVTVAMADLGGGSC